MSAYREIIADLREALLRGDYGNGNRLPTEEELQQTYGVGRQTVRRAYQELVGEGLVTRVQGRGTFAVSGADRGPYLRSFESPERLLGLVADTTMQVVEPFRPANDTRVAEVLGAPETDIRTVLFRRYFEGDVLCVTRVYLRSDIAAHILLTAHDDRLITIVGQVDGIVPGGISGMRQFITAVLAGKEEASQLSVAIGEPLLRVEHHFFDSDQVFQEVGISYYRPDRYTHAVEIRRPVR